jgi:RimJ/RimL family protein N-acetyltransferase
MADAQASHFVGGPQVASVAWRGLLQVAGAWVIQGFSMFAAIERASGRWVGRLGPWRPEGWPGPEVGWALIQDVRGKGYATEGAAAAIDWAFNHLGWSEVIHAIEPANTASQAVARRLGSINRGPGAMPAPYQDAKVEIWGQSRDDWRRRQAVKPSTASMMWS